MAENFDATIYSTSAEAMQKINKYVANCSYNYDKEKLEKELCNYIDIREKYTDAEHFQWLLNEAEKLQDKIIEGLSPKTKTLPVFCREGFSVMYQKPSKMERSMPNTEFSEVCIRLSSWEFPPAMTASWIALEACACAARFCASPS